MRMKMKAKSGADTFARGSQCEGDVPRQSGEPKTERAVQVASAAPFLVHYSETGKPSK